jgi:hypothetical protein
LSELEKFEGKKFHNYLGAGKTGETRKTYTVRMISMHPDTGVPMINYVSDKSGKKYCLDSNTFFGMIKAEKATKGAHEWLPRFTLAPGQRIGEVVPAPASKAAT